MLRLTCTGARLLQPLHGGIAQLVRGALRGLDGALRLRMG